MADSEQQEENIPMSERGATSTDTDYDFGNREKETDFGGTEPLPGSDEDAYVVDDENLDMGMSEEDANKVRNKINLKRWKTLREVFNEIIGAPIRKKDNDKLFEKSIIRTRESGHKELWYDGKRIYYKNRGEGSKWTLYSSLKSNPMTAEFEKAKKKYEKSATKQTNDAAGVNLPEEISVDVIRNVLTEMYDDLDLDTEFVTLGTQAGFDTRRAGTLTEDISVEKLQGRLRTLEKIISSQRKNFIMKSRELNELRARGASEDVINEKELEINDLQEKLKKVESEKDELLDKVEVGDIILEDTLEEVRELKEENRDAKEKFEKFKEEAERQKDIAVNAAVQEYWDTRNEDEETAKQQYSASVRRIKLDFKEQMDLADSKIKDVEDRLKRSEEKLKYLQQAEHKQHERPDHDSTDRVVPGVQESTDRIYSIIEKSNPKYDELSDDDLERDLESNIAILREQAKNFEQKAKNSEGITKQTYEDIQKNIELKIDEINLRLDREVEYEVTKQKLKNEVENNPGVKWEKF